MKFKIKIRIKTFWKFYDTKWKPEFWNDVKNLYVSTLFTKTWNKIFLVQAAFN